MPCLLSCKPNPCWRNHWNPNAPGQRFRPVEARTRGGSRRPTCRIRRTFATCSPNENLFLHRTQHDQDQPDVAPKEGSRLNLQHSSETFHLSGPDSDRSIVAPPDGEFAAIEEGFENGA